MTSVTIEVADVHTTAERMKAAFRGEPQGAFITFPTHEALWQTLTAERWVILKTLTGAGPTRLVELARLVGRELPSVRADIDALAAAGVIDQTADGKSEFPYDEVRVAFMLKAA
jgi:predicted transcriptional regulator